MALTTIVYFLAPYGLHVLLFQLVLQDDTPLTLAKKAGSSFAFACLALFGGVVVGRIRR